MLVDKAVKGHCAQNVLCLRSEHGPTKVYSAPTNSAIDTHLVDSSILPVTPVIERIYLSLQIEH